METESEHFWRYALQWNSAELLSAPFFVGLNISQYSFNRNGFHSRQSASIWSFFFKKTFCGSFDQLKVDILSQLWLKVGFCFDELILWDDVTPQPRRWPWCLRLDEMTGPWRGEEFPSIPGDRHSRCTVSVLIFFSWETSKGRKYPTHWIQTSFKLDQNTFSTQLMLKSHIYIHAHTHTVMIGLFLPRIGRHSVVMRLDGVCRSHVCTGTHIALWQRYH